MADAVAPAVPDGFTFIAELMKAQTSELSKSTRLQREQLEVLRDSRDVMADLRDELKKFRELMTRLLDSREGNAAIAVARTASQH